MSSSAMGPLQMWFPYIKRTEPKPVHLRLLQIVVSWGTTLMLSVLGISCLQFKKQDILSFKSFKPELRNLSN